MQSTVGSVKKRFRTKKINDCRKKKKRILRRNELCVFSSYKRYRKSLHLVNTHSGPWISDRAGNRGLCTLWMQLFDGIRTFFDNQTNFVFFSTLKICRICGNVLKTFWIGFSVPEWSDLKRLKFVERGKDKLGVYLTLLCTRLAYFIT